MLETKATKRKLRELAELVYKRDLSRELTKLEMEFARWRAGEIDPFELSERIHRYHDGVSRKLYVTYQNLPASQAIAWAIARQVLDRAEVPAEILADLRAHIPFFEEQARLADWEGDPEDESRDAHRRPGINARARNSAP